MINTYMGSSTTSLASIAHQGVWAKAGWQQFFHATPTRICRAMRVQRSKSAEKTAPAKPYSVLFASVMASYDYERVEIENS